MKKESIKKMCWVDLTSIFEKSVWEEAEIMGVKNWLDDDGCLRKTYLIKTKNGIIKESNNVYFKI